LRGFNTCEQIPLLASIALGSGFLQSETMKSTKANLLQLANACSCCALLAALFLSSGCASTRTRANLPWDWTGIVGTGQSLSVGASPVLSTNQPHGNLKLSSGRLPWPVNPDATNLALVPLVEPVGRHAPAYPSSWPENIYGETPHSAMANQLTAMVRSQLGRDFVSVHGAVGESGQGMVFIKKNAVPKGVNGHDYEASLIEAKAVTRLAKAAGKTYGIGAIVLTHGENDAGNANYKQEIHQLWQDYNADLPAITGQKEEIQMILSQQNSCNDRSPSTLAQWQISDGFPADMVCSGPKYQYQSPDGVHLTSEGYRLLGEKYAEVYFQRVILGHDWRPLEPTGVERYGKILTVHFRVPAPPLVWEKDFELPHSSSAAWKNGKGFEVSSAGGDKVAIVSAEIAGSDVIITCATDVGSSARLSYAMIGEKPRMQTPFQGTYRWGLLRDSDPFQGAVTGTPQPNYGVAFELLVP